MCRVCVIRLDFIDSTLIIFCFHHIHFLLTASLEKEQKRLIILLIIHILQLLSELPVDTENRNRMCFQQSPFIQQDTLWGRLDDLVIDTPPGTSDEHLTIIKLLASTKPDGAVIITAPQKLSAGVCVVLGYQRNEVAWRRL